METTFNPVSVIAGELSLRSESVRAVLALLGEGNTVPFIARYRKEATGDLDEVQIRAIQERHTYLDELHQRKAAVLESIAQQGKLTDELRARIVACAQKAELEDLYLPYRPKRRTRATKARERGLQPLAELILAQPLGQRVEDAAAAFVNAELEVPTWEDALQGAKDIVAETVAETAEVRAMVRDTYLQSGRVRSVVDEKKKAEAAKFSDYFDFDEALKDIPSHRFLAIRRGEREGFLTVRVEAEGDPLVRRAQRMFGLNGGSPFAGALMEAVEDAYRRLLHPSIEGEVLTLTRERADDKAIEVFAENLRNLLLAPPAGARNVLAVDPGLRTGSKVVAITHIGQYTESRVLHLVGSAGAQEKARRDLLAMVATWQPFAVAIGNGTGGRETEAFIKETLAAAGIKGVIVVAVSEAGASVYSASDIARAEFPELDLTIRGAISIGRRFQDPLAELVKIDPKAIGVGQYQHDVNPTQLARKLDEVVESAVNLVGVELNTASAPLLSNVSGIGPSLAGRIVEHRHANGPFTSRAQLRLVRGLGPKTFEQAAGFLRVREGEHPLDASAVHPERYALVEAIARDLGVELAALIGNEELIGQIDVRRYVKGDVGEPTLRDIIAELRKPGRDPRQSFEPPAFRDDVHTLEDLKVGMKLEGVVTNVTAFGAFVDIGVHQDGLVHISQLADRFVRDPHEVVKVGQRLAVTVMEVDLKRQRIGLSARTNPEAGGGRPPRGEEGGGRGGESGRREDRGKRGNDRGGRGDRNDRNDRNDRGKPASDNERLTHNPFANLRKR